MLWNPTSTYDMWSDIASIVMYRYAGQGQGTKQRNCAARRHAIWLDSGKHATRRDLTSYNNDGKGTCFLIYNTDCFCGCQLTPVTAISFLKTPIGIQLNVQEKALCQRLINFSFEYGFSLPWNGLQEQRGVVWGGSKLSLPWALGAWE